MKLFNYLNLEQKMFFEVINNKQKLYRKKVKSNFRLQC